MTISMTKKAGWCNYHSYDCATPTCRWYEAEFSYYILYSGNHLADALIQCVLLKLFVVFSYLKIQFKVNYHKPSPASI